jgi:hypothetical protein
MEKQFNIDAAQREIDQRAAEGEDMSRAYIDPVTYAIRKGYPCKDCIIDMMESSGPQDMGDLRRECKTQAVPYSQALFDAALTELLSSGRIVADVSNEDSVPVIWYDFPDSYYTAQIS